MYNRLIQEINWNIKNTRLIEKKQEKKNKEDMGQKKHISQHARYCRS